MDRTKLNVQNTS